MELKITDHLKIKYTNVYNTVQNTIYTIKNQLTVPYAESCETWGNLPSKCLVNWALIPEDSELNLQPQQHELTGPRRRLKRRNMIVRNKHGI